MTVRRYADICIRTSLCESRSGSIPVFMKTRPIRPTARARRSLAASGDNETEGLGGLCMMTNSSLVGCWTGRSAGLAPLESTRGALAKDML
jgi:hypothetical protein